MKRVLLKLSGEALARATGEIYDTAFVDEVAGVLFDCAKRGYEIAVVVGAGNIWRGRQGTEMDRMTADHMGMLATVINALCLKDALVRKGASATVMTAISMAPFTEGYDPSVAKKYLAEGRIVVFGAGLGIPFVSTDTAGAVRAAEIGADAILMAKNIDYIYTADPRVDPTAKRLETISCSEILAKDLRAIDATAAAFCKSVGMPIRIFGLSSAQDIASALDEKKSGTLVTPN